MAPSPLPTVPPARRRPSRGRRVALVALVLGLLAVLWLPVQVWCEVNLTRLERVRVTTRKLAPGATLRVFQVTDFHDLRSERQIDGVIAEARRQRPDVVALTGDFVHTHSEDLVMVERLLRGLRGVSEHVYFVRGNHDAWNAGFGTRLDLMGLLERVGIPVLDNTHVTVRGAFGEIEVLGTDDYFDGDGDLAAAARGADPSRFWLLLTHAPEVGRDLRGSGVDLALCGHTHGGQVRIPFVGAPVLPGQEAFGRYDKGMFDDWGGPKLWIDSGMGWTSKPVRLFDPSQVTLVEVVGE